MSNKITKGFEGLHVRKKNKVNACFGAQSKISQKNQRLVQNLAKKSGVPLAQMRKMAQMTSTAKKASVSNRMKSNRVNSFRNENRNYQKGYRKDMKGRTSDKKTEDAD